MHYGAMRILHEAVSRMRLAKFERAREVEIPSREVVKEMCALLTTSR